MHACMGGSILIIQIALFRTFFYKVYACVYGGLKVMINKDHINLDLIAPTSITNIFKNWLDMTNKRTKGANSCGSLCFSLVYMELL